MILVIKKMQISQCVMLIKPSWACLKFLFGFSKHDHKKWMRIKECGYGYEHACDSTLFSFSMISSIQRACKMCQGCLWF